MNKITEIGGMDTVTFRVAKAGWQEEVALADIPPATLAELVRYGAQRWWNDKTAGMEADEAKAKIAELWEVAIKSEAGWQGRAPITGRTSANPLEAEMSRMAQEAIKQALKGKGIPLKSVKDRMPELVGAYLSKNEQALRVQAEKILAARAAAPDVLADLGLDL